MFKKNLLNLIIISIVSLFTYSGYAQSITIKGTVRGSGSALQGSSVRIGNSGTTTDANGNYELSVLPGKYVIIATYIGYQSGEKNISIKLGQPEKVDFNLEFSSNLSEVVVLGSRSTPRTQLETAVPIDLIDIKKLAGVGAQVTLNQILNFAAPSFTSNTQSLGDGTDHVDPASIRGLGPDQVS